MYCSGNIDSLWFFADVGTKNVRRGRLSYPCRRCICCFGKCQQHNHSIGEVKIAITISIVFFLNNNVFNHPYNEKQTLGSRNFLIGCSFRLSSISAEDGYVPEFLTYRHVRTKSHIPAIIMRVSCYIDTMAAVVCKMFLNK